MQGRESREILASGFGENYYYFFVFVLEKTEKLGKYNLQIW